MLNDSSAVPHFMYICPLWASQLMYKVYYDKRLYLYLTRRSGDVEVISEYGLLTGVCFFALNKT